MSIFEKKFFQIFELVQDFDTVDEMNSKEWLKAVNLFDYLLYDFEGKFLSCFACFHFSLHSSQIFMNCCQTDTYFGFHHLFFSFIIRNIQSSCLIQSLRRLNSNNFVCSFPNLFSIISLYHAENFSSSYIKLLIF